MEYIALWPTNSVFKVASSTINCTLPLSGITVRAYTGRNKGDVRPLFAPGESTSQRRRTVADCRSALPKAEAEQRHTSGSALVPRQPWLPPPAVDRIRSRIAGNRSGYYPWTVWHRERREGRQVPTSGRLVAAVAPQRQPRWHI